jgi:GTP-binding protein HflX
VSKVLSEIGAAGIPEILVLNKIDRLPAADDSAVAGRRLLAAAGLSAETAVVAISALTGWGIPELLARIDDRLPLDPVVRENLRIPAGDGATLALLHEYGRVLEARYSGEWCHVVAEIPESLKRRLRASRKHEA